MKSTLPCVALFWLLTVGQAAAMSLASADIQPNSTIAARHIYTRCGGGNLSPQLSWSGAPKATQSFVVTMIDLDVKPHQWSHWILVDLPPTTTSLARGLKAPPGHAQVLNSDFGDAAYDGPCPPKGSGLHRYQITVWALPAPVAPLRSGDRATDVVQRLLKLAIDRASFIGTVRG